MYKIFDRVLVGILAVAVVAIGGGMLAVAWDAALLEQLFFMLQDSMTKLWVTGLCIVLILISLRLLLFAGRRPKEMARITVSTGDFGTVEITLNTLSQLVNAFVAKVDGIVASKHNLRPGENGLGIYLRVGIREGASIPEVSRQVQQSLKVYMEHATGIAVAEVGVLVDNPVGKTREVRPAEPAKPVLQGVRTVAMAQAEAQAEQTPEQE